MRGLWRKCVGVPQISADYKQALYRGVRRGNPGEHRENRQPQRTRRHTKEVLESNRRSELPPYLRRHRRCPLVWGPAFGLAYNKG